MSWVLLGMAILGAGAVGSVLIPRRFAASLPIGLGAVAVSAGLCLAGGWGVLTGQSSSSVDIDWPLPLGTARLAIDGLSAWFLLLIGFVGLASAVYSWGYFRDDHAQGLPGTYSALFCTLFAAMVLVVCAADAVLFLVGWELMSLSAFFLVGFHHQEAEARRGAWMYLVATHLGTALGVLPVFAAFAARTGGTTLSSFSGAFSPSEAGACVVLFALGVIGFGTKAGLMPFHIWLPVAHPVAPSPVSALMSGVVIKTGIYGLLRLLSWLPELPAGCGIALMGLSLVTGVMGILYALGQRQIKRMLAYSSVENIGIIGVAISVALLGESFHQPALAALGFGGALLHVLNHSLFKGLLFLSAGAVLHGTGTVDIERLGGLVRRTPLNGLAFLVGAVAICALPPLNGFVSEFAIYAGLLNGLLRLPGSIALVFAVAAATLALVGGIALVAFSRVFSIVFMGEPRDPGVTAHATPTSMNAGMMLLVLGCAAAATGASWLAGALARAVRPVLGGASVPLEALHESIGLITRLAPPLAVLIVIGVGLFLLRRRMPRGAAAGGAGGTWGCGYANPRSTMQYTGSSYAWNLIHSFRHLVGTKRRVPGPSSCFPRRAAELETSTPDAAHDRLYKPLFSGAARAFERLWPLQHGRIQLYLVYIVATVLIVFLIDAMTRSSPHR